MISKIIRQLRKINQKYFQITFKRHNLDQLQSTILNDLNNDGIYLGKFQDFQKLGADMSWTNYKDEIINFLDEKEKIGTHKSNKKGSYVIGMRNIPDHILKRIYSFSLNEKFIQIFENYFSLPLHYKGVDIRKDVNDGNKIETRLWHIDSEDNRIIKILIYLDKVDSLGGPFMYIKKRFINKKTKFEKKRGDGRIEDESMEKVCNTSNLMEFTNETFDFAIVDTANIYHKGKLPDKSRYAAFFCYNSKYPLEPSFCVNFQKKDRSMIEKKFLNKVAESNLN